jgi:hypothetical protein
LRSVAAELLRCQTILGRAFVAAFLIRPLNMTESAEEMAQRLTKLAEEFKAAGRYLDATAAMAGALAIYLDQLRAAATRQETIERRAQVAAAKQATARHAEA